MVYADVMIPVYNEEQDLEKNILKLRRYLNELESASGHNFKIVIVDNASTDGTQQIGEQLQTQAGIGYLRLNRKGRGYALHTAWDNSTADVVSYMDVDLSTSLDHTPELLLAIMDDEHDMVVGSRLHDSSKVTNRKLLREVTSRGYNMLLHFFMDARFRDAQCGFKAIMRAKWVELSPEIEDDAWFFDTEVLLKAQYQGLRIGEVPVDWADDPGSTVHVGDTIKKDLQGMQRVYKEKQPRSPFKRLMPFAIIGLASTLAYGIFYFLFNLFLTNQAANLVTLLVVLSLNTALNRRFTFRRSGQRNLPWHLTAGVAAFLLSWLVPAVGISVMNVFYIEINAHPIQEAFLVMLCSVLAAVFRYLVFSLGFRENTHLDLEGVGVRIEQVALRLPHLHSRNWLD